MPVQELHGGVGPGAFARLERRHALESSGLEI